MSVDRPSDKFIDGARLQVYNFMQERFQDPHNPGAFVSFNLQTAELTSYDGLARGMLDTPTMDAAACAWPSYFSTTGVIHEDTKLYVAQSAQVCARAVIDMRAETFQNAEMLICLITKVGRVKSLYVRFIMLRDQMGLPAESLCLMFDITNKPPPPNVFGGYTLGHDEHQLCPLPRKPVSSGPDIVVRIRRLRRSDSEDSSRVPDAVEVPRSDETNGDEAPAGTTRVASEQDWHQYCHTWDWTKVRRVTNMHEKTTQRKRRKARTAPTATTVPVAPVTAATFKPLPSTNVSEPAVGTIPRDSP